MFPEDHRAVSLGLLPPVELEVGHGTVEEVDGQAGLALVGQGVRIDRVVVVPGLVRDVAFLLVLLGHQVPERHSTTSARRDEPVQRGENRWVEGTRAAGPVSVMRYVPRVSIDTFL